MIIRCCLSDGNDLAGGNISASGSAVPSRLPIIITDERMKGVDADVDAVATAQLEPGLGVRGGVHAIKF